MKIVTPKYSSEQRPLFRTNTVSRAIDWLCLSGGFAICCGVGVWIGYASLLLNTFMGVFGLRNVIRILRVLHRLRRHAARSEDILRSYTGLSAEAILAREEPDDAIAAKAIQGKCLKVARRLGDGHESIIACLEESLLREIEPASLAAKTLPGMGLVGTCVGLMGTLAAIGVGAADVGNTAAVSAAIGTSVPSMAIAISTTLAAAFGGSVVLMALTEIAKSEIRGFVVDLDAQLDMYPVL